MNSININGRVVLNGLYFLQVSLARADRQRQLTVPFV